MAWNDFSNMPWMQTSKPGEMLLKGVEAGSQIASNINRSRALQLQADEQSVMLPLQQQMAETKVKEQALQLATGLKAQEYDLQTKQGQAGLAEVFTKIADLPEGWANPEAYRWMGDVGKQFPAVVGAPAWQHGVDNIHKANAIKAATERNNVTVEQRRQAAAAKTADAAAKLKAANPFDLKPGDSQVIYDAVTGEDTGVRGMWTGQTTHYLPAKKSGMSDAQFITAMNRVNEWQKELEDPNISPERFTQLKGSLTRAKRLTQPVQPATKPEVRMNPAPGGASMGAHRVAEDAAEIFVINSTTGERMSGPKSNADQFLKANPDWKLE